MAEESNNNPLENEDENDDDNQREEYLPNVVRLEPDIGLGDRSQQQEDRKRRNQETSQPRREDGPISFRHFLQNDAGASSSSASSSAAYPDLYRCARQERPTPDAPAMDPENPVLPDFVQDNLALEHIYFNSDYNSKILPDFAPYETYSPDAGEASREHAGASGHRFNEESAQASARSGRDRIPLDLPVPNFLLDNQPQPPRGPSLPFDLTTQTGSVAASGDVRSPTETELAGTGGRLPDFLSDGHILGHGNTRHRDARIVTSENGTGADSNPERRNLIITLRQENNRLREELSILQSVLMKKDDRIKELEDLVMALEISKLQMSSDANTQTSKSSSDDEVSALRKELEAAKREVLRLQKEKINAFTSRYQNDPRPSRAELALKMKQMTDTSERLVQQLMKVIGDMKSDINVNEDTESTDKGEPKPLKGDDNPPQDSAEPSTSK